MKRKERAKMIAMRSRKKLEILLAAEPEAYKELFAVIGASSVAETCARRKKNRDRQLFLDAASVVQR
jgi:hypothetical protein